MTKFIGVISGKGGVGKTTTSINLASALNFFDKEVTLVDGNMSTPNIGLHLGAPVVPINLHHALRGEHSIHEAIYMHPMGTKIIPGSISVKDLKTTNPDKLNPTIKKLKGKSDYVLIDGAAGLGREAAATINAADQIVIVTNPEIPSITDALKTIKVCQEYKKPVIGVILTRTKNKYMDIPMANVENMLEKPIIGVIPEDKHVRWALSRKDAVVYTHPHSNAAIGYKRLAANILGIEYTPDLKKSDWFAKVLGMIGLKK